MELADKPSTSMIPPLSGPMTGGWECDPEFYAVIPQRHVGYPEYRSDMDQRLLPERLATISIVTWADSANTFTQFSAGDS